MGMRPFRIVRVEAVLRALLTRTGMTKILEVDRGSRCGPAGMSFLTGLNPGEETAVLCGAEGALRMPVIVDSRSERATHRLPLRRIEKLIQNAPELDALFGCVVIALGVREAQRVCEPES